jgi:hypothetical protein
MTTLEEIMAEDVDNPLFWEIVRDLQVLPDVVAMTYDADRALMDMELDAILTGIPIEPEKVAEVLEAVAEAHAPKLDGPKARKAIKGAPRLKPHVACPRCDSKTANKPPRHALACPRSSAARRRAEGRKTPGSTPGSTRGRRPGALVIAQDKETA